MKSRIRVLTNDNLAVAGRTYSRGSKGIEFEIDTDKLQSEEIKNLLKEGEIEIVEESSPPKEKD